MNNAPKLLAPVHDQAVLAAARPCILSRQLQAARGQLLMALALLLLTACSGRAPSSPRPGSEDVFAAQDSIRVSLLLRISQAQMELDRQAEMMRRRAYNAEKKLADRLNRKIAAAELALVELEAQSALLLADSVPSNWLEIQEKTDLIIQKASRTLQTAL